MHVSGFFRPLIALIAATVLFLGCDSEDAPSVPDQPVFSFTLTEDGNTTDLEGTANWTAGTSNDGQDAFGIIFNTPDQTASGFLTREGSAPSAGSYTIATLQSAALAPLTDFSVYFTVGAAGNDLPLTSFRPAAALRSTALATKRSPVASPSTSCASRS